jgi:adenosylmethionine-8-amino-7-oxononanoate aminotransferase
VRGDHVLFAPPFILEEAQLDELVEKFSAALSVTLGLPAALAA